MWRCSTPVLFGQVMRRSAVWTRRILNLNLVAGRLPQPFMRNDAKHRHAQTRLLNARVVSAAYVGTNVARL